MMNIPVQKWQEAIVMRCSRRSYIPVPLSQELVYHLWHIITGLNDSCEGARLELVTGNAAPVWKGLFGGYGKIKGAQAYAALIGDCRDTHMWEKVGYLGECFVLEATAAGLGTCWVGGSFRPDRVAQEINPDRHEAIPAITPVGYARKNYSIEEKVLSALVASHMRKPLAELCSGLPRDRWPSWAEAALEAARLAPSACNRQPWRFMVEREAITVMADKDNPRHPSRLNKRLDCGIAMLHLEVGALSCGVKGSWEYLAPPQVARFCIN